MARIDITIQLRTLRGVPITRLVARERGGKGRIVYRDPVPRVPAERRRVLRTVDRILRTGEAQPRTWWGRLLEWFRA